MKKRPLILATMLFAGLLTWGGAPERAHAITGPGFDVTATYLFEFIREGGETVLRLRYIHIVDGVRRVGSIVPGTRVVVTGVTAEAVEGAVGGGLVTFVTAAAYAAIVVELIALAAEVYIISASYLDYERIAEELYPERSYPQHLWEFLGEVMDNYAYYAWPSE